MGNKYSQEYSEHLLKYYNHQNDEKNKISSSWYNPYRAIVIVKSKLFFKSEKNRLQLLQHNDNNKLRLKTKGGDLFKLAQNQFNLNNLDSALQLFKECSQCQKLYLGDQSIQYARTIHQIALIEEYKHNYDHALKLYGQSLKIKEKKIGKINKSYANTLQNMGIIYYIKGDLNTAMNFYEQVLRIREKTIGKQNKKYGQTLQNIGVVYNKMKQYENALVTYEKARQIYKKTIEANNQEYAGIMNNIGVTYQQLGQYQTALGYYSQCVQIMIKTNNQIHPYFSKMKKSLQRMKIKLKSTLKENDLVQNE